MSPGKEVGSKAVEIIGEGVKWANPPKRYEEVNNTIECGIELGLHIEIEGLCSQGEEGHAAEEPPSGPDKPFGPPPGPNRPPLELAPAG